MTHANDNSYPLSADARPLNSRYSDVSRVLTRVLALNLAVAFVKLFVGYTTGAVSIVSDGFQSLTDSAANVIGQDVTYPQENSVNCRPGLHFQSIGPMRNSC